MKSCVKLSLTNCCICGVTDTAHDCIIGGHLGHWGWFSNENAINFLPPFEKCFVHKQFYFQYLLYIVLINKFPTMLKQLNQDLWFESLFKQFKR